MSSRSCGNLKFELVRRSMKVEPEASCFTVCVISAKYGFIVLSPRQFVLIEWTPSSAACVTIFSNVSKLIYRCLKGRFFLSE